MTSQSHMLPAYARVDLAFERGDGVWLTATNGDRYLDFASGVAVNALGHSHPQVVEAITEQAKKVIHVSNLYRIPEGERLAERLCAMTFADKVFFANSGAEAMEGVIKMVRKYQSANGHPERYRIISFEGSFHGRTLATLAAAKNKKHLDGFGPAMDGFDQVRLGEHAGARLPGDVGRQNCASHRLPEHRSQTLERARWRRRVEKAAHEREPCNEDQKPLR